MLAFAFSSLFSILVHALHALGTIPIDPFAHVPTHMLPAGTIPIDPF